MSRKKLSSLSLSGMVVGSGPVHVWLLVLNFGLVLDSGPLLVIGMRPSLGLAPALVVCSFPVMVLWLLAFVLVL